ncbi:hypothetical protein CRG98_011991 [Punica granatum]|uniref:Integrase catalytic domain-containing protein n=1 Tax=Punica granatum TaxID=22663 RepID=A0A2I0KGJ5_PUNGR|nr:hypothetical protein CRG98_011991 [Punica granatum]
MVSITKENLIEPLEFENSKGPVHCDMIEAVDGKSWYAEIKHLLQTGQFPAIDYFTKWIEAITLASVTAKAVACFLKRDIIVRYGVPTTLVTDNAKNLNNKLIHELCAQFRIQHRNSSPYHPQMNGARMAQAFNKKVCPREFSPGDLVLQKVLHIAPDSRGKFAYKYDGPFIVKEVFDEWAIILNDMNGNENALPVNADTLKKYYP